MAAKKAPTSVTIHSYQVGFGDCFLVSFNYGEDDHAERRHVLIDFGSTSLPKKGGFSLDAVATDIKEKTGGKLTAVVATHRHRDHISGFGGKNGKVIADLNPDVIVQPWTEHPKAQPGATEPPTALEGAKGFVGALAAMHDVARFSLQEIATLRASKTVKDQIAFLGDDNIANLDAINTLMNMKGEHAYVYYGSKSGLEKVLPGVTVHVLGPPTLKQSRAVEQQRSEDRDEFWHLQAMASRRTAATGKPLFPRAPQVTGSVLPVETRWFLPRIEAVRGDQLLEIVRILDKQMNNTSVILLFEVGTKKLLFPGDAQLENWMYSLKEAKEAAAVKKLLSNVDVYKVGHHGSLNATPKTLWNLFRKKNADEHKKGRLQTIVSTMAGKHGSVDRGTEVPRSKLVQAMKTDSTFATTQSLTSKKVPCLTISIPVLEAEARQAGEEKETQPEPGRDVALNLIVHRLSIGYRWPLSIAYRSQPIDTSIADLTGRICRSTLKPLYHDIESQFLRARYFMLQALVITLREGLEAFLIVAISLSYLRRSGRVPLTKAVHWGIVVAIALSALGGYLLYNAANQEWLEGPLALVAALSVSWLVVHMWRAGRRMKGDIEDRLQSSSARPGTAAFMGVFLFTVLMVSREGMETALLLMQVRETVNVAMGAVAGVLAAAGVAWLWSRYGRRVNLALFFQVTAIFLLVFVVQLVIYSVHEMSEQGFLPYSEAIHLGTEAWGPDSALGHLLTYLLVILPLGWLLIKSVFSGRQRPAGSKPAIADPAAQHSAAR